MARIVELVLLAQAGVYLLTGLWPLVSMRTFTAVTGPKVDRWLVRMVGLLAMVIGGTLLLAPRAMPLADHVALLSVGAALSFAAVDTLYAARGRISRVYLLDAAVETSIALVVGWGWLASG